MAMEYPSLADGCAHRDIPSMLTRDIYNSPMADYIPPPSPSFGEVETSLIHKDNFRWNRTAFNLKDSLQNTSKHKRVYHYPEAQFKRAQMAA